jgi:hypothetical protein
MTLVAMTSPPGVAVTDSVTAPTAETPVADAPTPSVDTTTVTAEPPDNGTVSSTVTQTRSGEKRALDNDDDDDDEDLFAEEEEDVNAPADVSTPAVPPVKKAKTETDSPNAVDVEPAKELVAGEESVPISLEIPRKVRKEATSGKQEPSVSSYSTSPTREAPASAFTTNSTVTSIPRKVTSKASKYGLPDSVVIPPSVDENLLEGRLLEMLKSLPPNLMTEALNEYHDAVGIKGHSIRNHGAYLNGVLKRYTSVHMRATEEGSGILPMGENLTPLIRSRLERLVATGFCSQEEMHDKVQTKIRSLSEKDAIFALDELTSVDRSNIRNFGSYFMGILNRYMRGDHSSKIQKGPRLGGDRGPPTINRNNAPPRGNPYAPTDRYGSPSKQSFPNNNNRGPNPQWGPPGGNDGYNNPGMNRGPMQHHHQQAPPSGPNYPALNQYSSQPPSLAYQQPPPMNAPFVPNNSGPYPGSFNAPPTQASYNPTGPAHPSSYHANGPPHQHQLSSYNPNSQPPQQQQPSYSQPPNPYGPPQTYSNTNPQPPYGANASLGNNPIVSNTSYGGYKAPHPSQVPVDIMGLADKAASAVQALASQSNNKSFPPQQQAPSYQGGSIHQGAYNTGGTPQYGGPQATSNSPYGPSGLPPFGGNPPLQPQQSYNAGPPPQQQQIYGMTPDSVSYNPTMQQPPSFGPLSGGNSGGRRRTTAKLQDLPMAVQFAVQNLTATGQVNGPLDEGILGMVVDLPEQMALEALRKFSTIDKSSMRNPTAYLAGLLRRDLEKIHKR